MPRFSQHSLAILATCDPRLQRLFNEVVKHRDCTIMAGARSVAEQQALYAIGRTKPGAIVTKIDGVHIKSKHNYSPSLAVDVTPYPEGFAKRSTMLVFAGFVLGIAAELGIAIRWGGDWDRNNDPDNQPFQDDDHFELVD